MGRAPHTMACQTALTVEDYERVKHQAWRRNMSIRDWVREQVLFGLEAEEEDEVEKQEAKAEEPRK